MKSLKRFNIKEMREQGLNPYEEIEDYIYDVIKCTDDYLVTFADPDTTLHTHYFDIGGYECPSCKDDYIEGQEYLDLIGICRLWNIAALGINEGVVTCDCDDYHSIVLDDDDTPSLAEAINMCNEALRGKPELDFSGIEIIK